MRARGIGLALWSMLAFAPWMMGASCARDAAILSADQAAHAMLGAYCRAQCDAIGRTCVLSDDERCEATDGRGQTDATPEQRAALIRVRETWLARFGVLRASAMALTSSGGER